MPDPWRRCDKTKRLQLPLLLGTSLPRSAPAAAAAAPPRPSPLTSRERRDWPRLPPAPALWFRPASCLPHPAGNGTVRRAVRDAAPPRDPAAIPGGRFFPPVTRRYVTAEVPPPPSCIRSLAGSEAGGGAGARGRCRSRGAARGGRWRRRWSWRRPSPISTVVKQ